MNRLTKLLVGTAVGGVLFLGAIAPASATAVAIGKVLTSGG